MKKNILTLMISILSLFILVGCGKEAAPKENKQPVATGFTLVYQGVNLLPGTEFKASSLTEEAVYSEIESCAFEGMDKIYTYADFEITTSDINEKEAIYSVYFLTDNISTTEGIKITDEKNQMLEKYGNPDSNLDNQYVYSKDQTELYFIIENDIITSIEYKYLIEN